VIQENQKMSKLLRQEQDKLQEMQKV